jgi:site-specific DNA recombinase
MKKKAIIYTRVSTDEQNNGYSPADQKEKLYKYCEHNNIEVVGFYHDDESGKTFNRPEWIKIMRFIKKNKGCVDNILFLKWDRFSRNVAEAYITIRDLKIMGVEPQSIEQPLNFEIPESKIMLAIYLAAPEVDNDRRTLNIFHGIRKGKKEGRWLGTCLRGYKNVRDENNRPIIIPEGGKQEELIKKAFSEYATGLYNIEELRKRLNKEGLKSTRNAFWTLLRNKGYIGKIFVRAYKEEPAQWVQGQHQALIDEQTFYKVQDILEGRKRNLPNKILTHRKELPLRGFLQCPQCSRTLTGSASRGRLGGLFFYYHCSNGCKERQKAKEMNKELEAQLREYNSQPEAMKYYAKILKDKLKTNDEASKVALEKNVVQQEKQQMRLRNAKNLMLDGEFSSEEYKKMKVEIEEILEKFKREEAVLKQGKENLGSDVDKCLELLLSLEKYYEKGETVTKQRIIGSIFSEKLVFENKKYRTPKTNRVVSLICNNDNPFEGNKKRKDHNFHDLSHRVDPRGVEPPTNRTGICHSIQLNYGSSLFEILFYKDND